MTAPRPDFPADPDARLATLSNGVRVLALQLPHVDSVQISVFVRTGSRHESKALNGISHVVEHMAFKGTHERTCQQINLDAERLGADVNAHTDKDHTAYHMRGLARDAGRFVRMLGDIVRNSTFPEAELERERQVILHEFTEDEDDPLSTAYKLFDKMCFGTHPLAQPVIGTRRNIERFTRDDLLGYVARQYSADNVVIGIAGNVDAEAMFREAEAAFGTMARGPENLVEAPAYVGGVASKRQPGFSQAHLVLGFPIPTLREDHQAAVVAAALFGEGMSSPLMDEIRERRGLAYYAACSADVFDLSGQCVIEASTSAAQLGECVTEVSRLLARQAASVAGVDLERARNQITVRQMRTHERPVRRLEAAVQDLFVFDRVRSRAELAAGIEAVTADQVRDAFALMLASKPAVAVAGKVSAGTNDRIGELIAAAAA
jgi:predicted Zn-dependent peptidase